MSGLYDPKLGQDLAFPLTNPKFVQIVHVGNHWLTVGVSPSLARVYDSMNFTTSVATQPMIDGLNLRASSRDTCLSSTTESLIIGG